MARPTNDGKTWTPAADKQLRDLAKQNTRVSGIMTGRTPGAVQGRASEIELWLKPTNQSPYNRRRN